MDTLLTMQFTPTYRDIINLPHRFLIGCYINQKSAKMGKTVVLIEPGKQLGGYRQVLH